MPVLELSYPNLCRKRMKPTRDRETSRPPLSHIGQTGPVYSGSADAVRVINAPQSERRLQSASRECLPDVEHTARHLAVGSKTYPPLDAHISSSALSGGVSWVMRSALSLHLGASHLIMGPCL